MQLDVLEMEIRDIGDVFDEDFRAEFKQVGITVPESKYNDVMTVLKYTAQCLQIAFKHYGASPKKLILTDKMQFKDRHGHKLTTHMGYHPDGDYVSISVSSIIDKLKTEGLEGSLYYFGKGAFEEAKHCADFKEHPKEMLAELKKTQQNLIHYLSSEAEVSAKTAAERDYSRLAPSR